jgi:hypothetical protein
MQCCNIHMLLFLFQHTVKTKYCWVHCRTSCMAPSCPQASCTKTSTSLLVAHNCTRPCTLPRNETKMYTCQHLSHHRWHDSPLWAIAFLEFPDNRIFTGRGCEPHAQPPTWRTRPSYLWPPETGWPSYTPSHWVPILVAFCDMHELCWDYSYPPVTTRRQHLKQQIKVLQNARLVTKYT